jgi:hypothetical protein
LQEKGKNLYFLLGFVFSWKQAAKEVLPKPEQRIKAEARGSGKESKVGQIEISRG